MKLFTAEKMHQLDQLAIRDFTIPGSILMENAGRETVRLMQDKLGDSQNSFALIFAGPGNNGGDGLVIGRHLNQLGCTPLFCFLSDPQKLPSDSLLNYKIIEKTELSCFHLYKSNGLSKLTSAIDKQYTAGKHCYAIIDAIFGIGLGRDVTGLFSEIITLINNRNIFSKLNKPFPVVACDIPSGLCADSGNILGTSVKADITATYSQGKPGLYMNDGGDVCGEIHRLDIAIPDIATKSITPDAHLLEEKMIVALLAKNPRPVNSHKGSNGHIFLVAGSEGMTGAAILAAKGCLRSGSGLVSIAVPEKLNSTFEITLPEAMTFILNSKLSYFSQEDFHSIAHSGKEKEALLIGPGLGQKDTTSTLVKRLYGELSQPMIIDADGINILAKSPEVLFKPKGPRIFTPHPGEMGRLLQTTTKHVQKNCLKAAKKFLQQFANCQHEVVIVLKGAGTLIGSSRHSEIYLNPTGNNGMATGGMGDVLSGITGGLLCQKFSLFDAAKIAVYLHGMAADMLLSEKGIGYNAREVADIIPRCRKTLQATR